MDIQVWTIENQKSRLLFEECGLSWLLWWISIWTICWWMMQWDFSSLSLGLTQSCWPVWNTQMLTQWLSTDSLILPTENHSWKCLRQRLFCVSKSLSSDSKFNKTICRHWNWLQQEVALSRLSENCNSCSVTESTGGKSQYCVYRYRPHSSHSRHTHAMVSWKSSHTRQEIK